VGSFWDAASEAVVIVGDTFHIQICWGRSGTATSASTTDQCCPALTPDPAFDGVLTALFSRATVP
jgi:hypothetical protein